MPEFFAEHTPSDLDNFTRGYFDCAEWLLGEDVNRSKIRGWRKSTREDMLNDCRCFQKDNAERLVECYTFASNYTEYRAGMDFWLTRNRHGAGFWDQGPMAGISEKAKVSLMKALAELTEVSHAYGEVDLDVYLGWIGA